MIGVSTVDGQGLAGGAGVVVLILNYICFCRVAGLEFGSSGLLREQSRVHYLLCGIAFLVGGVPWALTYPLQEWTNLTIILRASHVILALSVITVVMLAGARSLPLFGALACAIRGLVSVLVPSAETPPHSAWTAVICGVAILPVGSVKYRMEQCSLAFVPLVIATSIHAGATFSANRRAPFWLLVSMLLSYLQVLWMRRKRILPPSLRGCRFVRLSYLRHIAANREGIRRCQDLPPEAFGDPSKAKYLLAISHRWMDRFTCDVKTEDCPEGLRLRTLLEKLNLLFSTTGIGQGPGFWDKLRRFQYAMSGGSDVLIFLDFMSLPQVGKLEDGTLVPRTPEESSIFQECLPSMGILYSMFPVLVCEEVVRGSVSYLDSGWCFSESSIAWLGRRLAVFPSNSRVVDRFEELVPDQNNMQRIRTDLDGILATKMFLFETDRGISRTMIEGFALKRRLVISIQNSSAFDLRQVLAELREGGFKSLIDQPIDQTLNTPLHMAVALNFCEGVRLLLDAGADKQVRNLFGDTAVQYLLFPRLRRAARLCRRLESRLPEAARDRVQQDTFHKLADRFTIHSNCNSTRDSNADSNYIFQADTYGLDPSANESPSREGRRSGSWRLIVSLDDVSIRSEGQNGEDEGILREVTQDTLASPFASGATAN